MFFLVAASLFLLGAVAASFVGVVVVRLNTSQSFFIGRSSCDSCAAPLSSRALVPVFSFLLLKGRASCCGSSLSVRAPLTELLLGILFVLAYRAIGLTPALLPMLVSLSLLLALVLYDIDHHILPSPLLVLFVATSAFTGYALAPSPNAFVSSSFVALLLASFLAGIHIISRGRAMGLADAPFVLGCALLTGPAALSGFVFSFWIGAVIGIIVLLQEPRGFRMGIEVPFAPYLAAGFLLAYFTQWDPFIFIAALPSAMGMALGLPLLNWS